MGVIFVQPLFRSPIYVTLNPLKPSLISLLTLVFASTIHLGFRDMFRLFSLFAFFGLFWTSHACAEYELRFSEHKYKALEMLKSAEVSETWYSGFLQWDDTWADEFSSSHFVYFPFVLDAAKYDPNTKDKIDDRFSLCFLTTQAKVEDDDLAINAAFFLWSTNAWNSQEFYEGDTADKILAENRHRNMTKFSPRRANQLVGRLYHCDAYYAEVDAAKIFVEDYLQNAEVIARNADNEDWFGLDDGITFIPKDAFLDASATLFGFEDHNHRTAHRAGYNSYAEMEAAKAERIRLLSAGDKEVANFYNNIRQRFSSLRKEVEATFDGRRPYKDDSGIFSGFFGSDDSLFSAEPKAKRVQDLDSAARSTLLNLLRPELHKDQEILMYGPNDLQSLEAQLTDLICKWNVAEEYKKRLFSNFHLFTGKHRRYEPVDTTKDYQIIYCEDHRIHFVERNTKTKFFLDNKLPKEMKIEAGSSIIIPDYLYDYLVRSRRDTADTDFLVGDRVVNYSEKDVIIPIGIENDEGMLITPPVRFTPFNSVGYIKFDENKCGKIFGNLEQLNSFFSPASHCFMTRNFHLFANGDDGFFTVGFDELSDGKRYLTYNWGYPVHETSNSLNKQLDGKKVSGTFTTFEEKASSIEPWVLYADPLRTKQGWDEFNRLKKVPGALFISQISLTQVPTIEDENVILKPRLELMGTLPSMYADGGGGQLVLEGKDAEQFIKFMINKAK